MKILYWVSKSFTCPPIILKFFRPEIFISTEIYTDFDLLGIVEFQIYSFILFILKANLGKNALKFCNMRKLRSNPDFKWSNVVHNAVWNVSCARRLAGKRAVKKQTQEKRISGGSAFNGIWAGDSEVEPGYYSCLELHYPKWKDSKKCPDSSLCPKHETPKAGPGRRCGISGTADTHEYHLERLVKKCLIERGYPEIIDEEGAYPVTPNSVWWNLSCTDDTAVLHASASAKYGGGYRRKFGSTIYPGLVRWSRWWTRHRFWKRVWLWVELENLFSIKTFWKTFNFRILHILKGFLPFFCQDLPVIWVKWSGRFEIQLCQVNWNR